MNKSILTSLVLVAIATNAQISLTKDTSFGNNGTVTISGVASPQNQLLLIPNLHSTFQGNKIFVSYPSHDVTNPSMATTQFTRLNLDGTLDTSFGNNGNISVPFFESNYFYANNNFFYINDGQKYLSNGQLDTAFGNNGVLQIANWNYKFVLPDGKIFSRNNANFSKYLSTGNQDVTYGINGVMPIQTSIEINPSDNGNCDFFFNRDNAIYELVSPSTGQSNIRKIDIITGNLDLSYGQNGYAQLRNTFVPATANYLNSVLMNMNDHTFINNFTDSNNVFFTRTNSQGNTDVGFGTNGVITASKIFNHNGVAYSASDTPPLVYNNSMIFLPAKSTSKEFGISCYSLDGNAMTVNNAAFYPLSGTSYNSSGYMLIKDQYLYVFYDNNISRYVIQESVLGTGDKNLNNNLLSFNNPFTDELSLNSNEKIREIEILDGAGRSVMKGKGSKINTASLLKGTYFIKITTESNKIITKKGIKK